MSACASSDCLPISVCRFWLSRGPMLLTVYTHVLHEMFKHYLFLVCLCSLVISVLTQSWACAANLQSKHSSYIKYLNIAFFSASVCAAARIQPYQFEPVRLDFERVLEHRVSFEANPMRYSMGFAKSHSLKCSLHKWAWCGAARKSARLNCLNLIDFRLTAGRLRGSSSIVIPGVVCELLQFAATQ